MKNWRVTVPSDEIGIKFIWIEKEDVIELRNLYDDWLIWRIERDSLEELRLVLHRLEDAIAEKE